LEESDIRLVQVGGIHCGHFGKQRRARQQTRQSRETGKLAQKEEGGALVLKYRTIHLLEGQRLCCWRVAQPNSTWCAIYKCDNVVDWANFCFLLSCHAGSAG
jgi:hypothetical protein